MLYNRLQAALHRKKPSVMSSEQHLVTFRRFLFWTNQLLQMLSQYCSNFADIAQKNLEPTINKKIRLNGTIWYSLSKNIYYFINIFICEGPFLSKDIYSFFGMISLCMLIIPYYPFIGWKMIYFKIEFCKNYLMPTVCV